MLWTNNNNISKSSSSTFLVNILSFIISVIFFGFVYTLFLQEYQNRNLFFLILFLFLLICNLIFYKFTRKIFDNLYSKTPLHILIISILFSLFIGLFITTFYPVEIPKLKLLSQQLEITATSDKNHYSTDNKVVVEGFIIDGEYVSYNQFHHDGRWVRTNNRLIFSGNESNTLKWKGHPSNSVLIIKTGPDCGKSIINWNGYIELFDLYSDDESEILIHHDHYS